MSYKAKLLGLGLLERLFVALDEKNADRPSTPVIFFCVILVLKAIINILLYLEAYCRAVIKDWGLGIFPGYFE